MKIVRILVIVVFILAAAVFGVSKVVDLKGRDPSVPEITSDRDILEISCEYTPDQLTAGLTAYDEKDGDLTDQIIAGNFSRFIEPGLCNVTYVVFDSSKQPGTLTRKVWFTDYHSPEFTLSEPLVFEEGEGNYSEVMERLGASDMLDGDLTDWLVQTDSDANYQKTGDYHIQVEVTNSFGDTSAVSLPVHVLGSGAHSMEIELSSWIVYLDQGEKIDPMEYVEAVYNGEGEEVSKDTVTCESSVDPDTPGTYEIHYEAADGLGHTAETWLTVVVRA